MFVCPSVARIDSWRLETGTNWQSGEVGMEAAFYSHWYRLQLAFPLSFSHPNWFNVTPSGAPDNNHYHLNYAIYLVCVFFSSFSDAWRLNGVLSIWHWCVPSKKLPLPVHQRSPSWFFLISLGGTITLAIIKGSEQMWWRQELGMEGWRVDAWGLTRNKTAKWDCVNTCRFPSADLPTIYYWMEERYLHTRWTSPTLNTKAFPTNVI